MDFKSRKFSFRVCALNRGYFAESQYHFHEDNVVGTSQVRCESHSNKTETGWWWMELSKTTWYNMSFRAHLIVPVRNQFSQTGSWELERYPKVFHITLQKCLCSLSQVVGQCDNKGLKAIKICQAERMLLDTIAYNEATLYVTGYFFL